MTTLFKNNAASTLAANLAAAGTSMTVGTGHGDRFPVVASPDDAFVTLENAAGNIEIVKITARTAGSDVMTIVRSQEGTVARDWVAGDIVSMRVTAASIQSALSEVREHVADTVDAHDASAISYGGNTNLSATNVEAALDELDNEKAAAGHTHTAAQTSYAGNANLSATDVEGALDELDNEKIAKAGDAFTGGVREARVAMGANDINIASGNYFSKTLGGATTFTVSNVPASGTAASFVLDLTNGGAYAITWWSGVKWAGGTAPTLTASGRDVLGFFTHDGGTTWTGLVLGKDVK